MNIHPVNHAKGDTNRYCGPSAISIVTRMASGEAARLLRHVTGKTSIKGVHTGAMSKAFAMCGIEMSPRSFVVNNLTRRENGKIIKPTIAQWLAATVTTRTAGRVFLVLAGDHYQIISGRRFCCGRTKEIVSITDKRAHRRARIHSVYELIARGPITIPAAARKPKVRDFNAEGRRELEKFCRERGIPKGKIEYDGGIKDFVIPPCDLFRVGFSTMHHDWDETLDRLEYCYHNPSVLIEGDGHYSR